MRARPIGFLLGLLALPALAQQQVAVLSREPIQFENQTTAYRVGYELNGRRYTVELPYDPGASLLVALDVPPPTSVAAPTPITTYVSAPQVISVVPSSTTYYIVESPSALPPVLAPFTLGLGLGLLWHGAGHGHYGHGHWRWR